MRLKPLKSGKGLFLLLSICLVFLFGVRLGTTAIGKWVNTPAEPVEVFQKKTTQGEVRGVTTQLKSQETGAVKAVADEITENSLVFRLKVYFLDTIQAVSAKFDTDVVVGNNVVVGNDLEVGSNLTVAGALITQDELTAPNVVYSIVAGTGVTIAGDQDITITNSDLGSSQLIFKNFKIGDNTIAASSNSDTLIFTAGTGIDLSNDGKTVTVAASASDLNVSGWNDDGTAVRLTTITDNVGIGTATPGYKLHVIGTSYFSGNATFAGGTVISSGIDNSSGGITNAGPITGATGLTSSGTITFSGLSTGILHSNVNGVVSSSAVNLAGADVTGSLSVTSGGTGVTSFNTGDILYASASNTLMALGAGAEGEVLTISSGIPDWGSSGAGAPCATCIVNNPGSTQTITPAAATAVGLVVKQASGGSVDVFRIESNDGANVFFKIDSSGNVTLGNQTSSGVFTVSPTSTDPISISPVAQGAGQYTGTITSLDLSANRSWTFPNESGVVCLASGNCSGTAASVGGSGTLNYISKWSSTFGLTDSVLYDDGTNVGIGTTTSLSKLHVAGTFRATGNSLFGADLSIAGHATVSGSLMLDQTADFNSTLGVNGATTLGSTLDVTGLATFGGNVGIGTTVPTSKLDVSGVISIGDGDSTTPVISPRTNLDVGFYSAVSGTTGIIGGSSGQNYLQISGAAVSSNTLISSMSGFESPYGSAASPSYRFYSADVDTGIFRPLTETIGFSTGGAERARVDNDGILSNKLRDLSGGNLVLQDDGGNVGIGTTIPGANLEVTGDRNRAGQLLVSSGVPQSDGSLLLGSTIGIGANIYAHTKADGTISAASSAPGLRFSSSGLDIITSDETSGTRVWDQKMRIGIDGNVGIGTTTPIGKLNVEGAATGKALAILNETGGQNIFTASASGITKFVIKNDGNVGIGTSSPSTPLHVVGDDGLTLEDQYGKSVSIKAFSASVGDGWLAFQAGGTNGTIAEFRDCCNAVFTVSQSFGTSNFGYSLSVDEDFTVNTDNLHVNSTTGNVGVGTTTPTANLNIFQTSPTANQILFQVGTDASATRFTVDEDGDGHFSGDLDLRNVYVGNGTVTGPTLSFINDPNTGIYRPGIDTLGFVTNSTEALTIIANGNVGIGSTTPNSALNIGSGSFRIGTNGDCNNDFCLGGSSIDTFWDYTIRNHNGGSLYLLSDGNVGIGTSATTAQLDVFDNAASAYSAKFFNDGDNVNRYGIVVQSGLDDQTAAGPSTLIQFNDGDGGAVGSITFGSSLTNYNTTSDARLKDVAGVSSKGLEDLMQVKVYDYSFKADQLGRLHTGFIAQELYEIFPDAVTAYLDDPTKNWQVDYGKLTPLIVQSIQEQQKQIADLGIRLTADGEVAGITTQEATIDPALSVQSELLHTSISFSEGLVAFIKKVEFQMQVTFNATTEFLATVVFRQNVTVDESLIIGKNLVLNENYAGSVTVPAGKKGVKVVFSTPFDKAPVVTVTATQKITGEYWITDTSEAGFLIVFSEAQGQESNINWHVSVVGNQNGITTEVLEFEQASSIQEELDQNTTVSSEVQPEELESAVLGASDSATATDSGVIAE